MRPIALLILTTCLFTSCDPQEHHQSFSNEDGSVKVELTASRTVQFDPWSVTIQPFRNSEKTKKMTVELDIADVGEKFAICKWLSQQVCVISFKHADDTMRHFKVTVTEDMVHIVEVME